MASIADNSEATSQTTSGPPSPPSPDLNHLQPMQNPTQHAVFFGGIVLPPIRQAFPELDYRLTPPESSELRHATLPWERYYCLGGSPSPEQKTSEAVVPNGERPYGGRYPVHSPKDGVWCPEAEINRPVSMQDNYYAPPRNTTQLRDMAVWTVDAAWRMAGYTLERPIVCHCGSAMGPIHTLYGLTQHATFHHDLNSIEDIAVYFRQHLISTDQAAFRQQDYVCKIQLGFNCDTESVDTPIPSQVCPVEGGCGYNCGNEEVDSILPQYGASSERSPSPEVQAATHAYRGFGGPLPPYREVDYSLTVPPMRPYVDVDPSGRSLASYHVPHSTERASLYQGTSYLTEPIRTPTHRG